MSRKHKASAHHGDGTHNGNAVSRPPRDIVFSFPNVVTVRQEVDPKADERYADEKSSRAAQLRATHRLNNISVGGICLTLLGLCGVYATLVQTRRQFALDQRPYVTADPVGFFDIFTGKPTAGPIAGTPIAVTVRINDIGKSPARNVTIRRYVFFGGNAEVELMSGREQPNYSGKQIFFPNQPGSTSAVTQTHARENQTALVPPQDLIKWDGSRPIIVFGNVFYQDAFGNKYCTEFADVSIGPAWLDASGKNTQGCENP